MTNYGARSGSGGVGTGVITNDDKWTLDIPDEVDLDEKSYANTKDDRSY